MQSRTAQRVLAADPPAIPGHKKPPPPPPVGMIPLLEPRWIGAILDQGVREGRAVAAYAPPASGDDSKAFEDWAVQVFRPGPPASADDAELVTMHQVAATRTPAQTLTANWLAGDGDRWMWDLYLKEWQQTVGPAQAAWGAALIDRARDVNAAINDRAKERFGRTRPYRKDATLTTVVPQSSASSPSYPSGHAARAFLDATILGHLMPARRAEFLRLAHQMAMSRVYGGVHYPTDVAAGAWEGALIAAWMLRNNPPPKS